MIELGEARTTDEREAVFRFWYSVYVEEIGRYRGTADHERRRLYDVPEDDCSRIFFARDGDVVVAACRFTWGADGFSDRQIQQYQLEPFLAELSPELMLVGERTMVAASPGPQRRSPRVSETRGPRSPGDGARRRGNAAVRPTRR